MTKDLSQWVEFGSFEQHGYELKGCLKFSNLKEPVHLALIGRCHSLLDGCSVYFWNQAERSEGAFPIHPMAPHQVGATGLFEVGAIEVVEDPDEENLGPQYRTTCLHLEWCGQNGHLRIELNDPLVEFLKGDQSTFAPERIQRLKESNTESVLEKLLPRIQPANPIQRRFAKNSLEEIKELDQAIESGAPGIPIHKLMDPPYEAAAAQQLNDEEIDLENKIILAQLARLGICIDLCDHVGPRELYGMLSNRVLEEETEVLDVTPIYGVSHFATYPTCPQCQREFEEEFAPELSGEMKELSWDEG